MKFFKILTTVFVIITLSLCVLLIVQAADYKKAETYEIGSAEMHNKVIICTLNSQFKNKLTRQITDYLEDKKTFVKVIDCADMADLDIDKWSAVILINHAEGGKMNAGIEKFLIARKGNYAKIILVQISGKGTWRSHNYNIDAITCASNVNQVERVLKQVTSKLKEYLK